METTYYLSYKDKERVIWGNNFGIKFPGYASLFGFTPAEVTAVINDVNMLSYSVNIVEIFTTEKEERVSYKNLLINGPVGALAGVFPAMPVIPPPPTAVLPGILPRIRVVVGRIKSHPNYTEAIGKDLGIIGAEQTEDYTQMKPILKLVLTGGFVDVQWKKYFFDAIRIEVDRGDGQGWRFLTIDTVPHYTDTVTPTGSATWKYRAMYLISDELVGQWSDVASITVG